MNKNELLTKFFIKENELLAKKSELISSEIGDYLDVDAGVIQLEYEPKEIRCIVWLDTSKYKKVDYVTSDANVWNHIVNVVYENKPKTIALDANNRIIAKKITLSEELTEKLAKIYEDEEYVKLKEEISTVTIEPTPFSNIEEGVETSGTDTCDEWSD